MTTTAYPPQTNGQTEWYKETILSRLRHHINEQQDNWDTFAQPLTTTYNAQTHTVTKTTPFSLILQREQVTASGLPRPSHVSPQTKESMPSKELRRALLDRVRTMQTRSVTAASLAKQRYKTNFSKHIKWVTTFGKDELVFLDKSTPAMSTTAEDTSRKLQGGKAGP